MKLNLVLCTCLLWLCTANINAQSCCAGGGSSCCCVAGGGSSSILPELEKHVIGLNYSYSSYNTTTYPGMNMSAMSMGTGEMVMNGPGVTTKGTMNTIQLYVRFILPKRFQIAVSLPVSFLKEASSAQTDRSSGLGDASVMAFCSIFAQDKFFGKKSKHQMRIGVGVKAPTGKFSMTPDGLFTTDLQLGTGSVDFIFNLNYTYRYRKFGVSVSPMYKKNLTNKDDYRFGDNVAGAVNLFYVFRVKDATITPKAGAIYSHTFYNVYQHTLLTGTGGDVLRLRAGVDIYYKNLAFSTSVAPVLMTINNWEGEPVPVLSYEAGLYYSFNQFKTKKNNSK